MRDRDDMSFRAERSETNNLLWVAPARPEGVKKSRCSGGLRPPIFGFQSFRRSESAATSKKPVPVRAVKLLKTKNEGCDFALGGSKVIGSENKEFEKANPPSY